MKLTAKAKIDSLQAIRAFAAISVMLFHGTQIIHERIDYIFLDNIFMVGFSGVDIFFVLSGFIILHTSSSSKGNIIGFLKKRFIRIYPVYWLVTAALVIKLFIFPSDDQPDKGSFEVIFGSFFLFPQKQYVVGVAWTLACEVVFYLVFAFTFFRNPKFLFFALLIWGGGIILFQCLRIKSGFYAIDALMHPVILNFTFGCLIAYLFKKRSYSTYSGWFFWGGLFLFFLMWSIYYQIKLSDPSAFNDNTSRVYFFGIPASLVIFGALYLQRKVSRLLVYLGDASYSIYLIHGTVLSFLIKAVIKFNQVEIFASLGGAVILFSCTLAICCCFYSLVERKILIFLNKPERLIRI